MTLVKQYIETPHRLPAGLKEPDAAGNMVPIPIGQWDVSEVTNMNSLFMHRTNFNEPLNNWNVSNVTNMSNMFNSCRHFNQPLGQWNVGRVTNMKSMFSNCWDFDQPLNVWANDTRRVENMESMFYDCKSFNKPLARWNVSGVRSMNDMFYMATRFRQNLSGWDVTNVRLLGLGLTWDVYARQMFDRSGMMEYRELWPRFGTPPRPPPPPPTVAPQVDPYQVHRESGKIDYTHLNAFYEEKLGEQEIPIPGMFPIIIVDSMIQFINTNDDTDQETRYRQGRGLVEIMNTRLTVLNYEEKSPVLRKSIIYTLMYVKRQPPTFQRAYVDAFVQDCTTAYEGTAGMTCAAGALERVILSVTNAIQTMNSLGQGNPEWDTLLDIITVSPRTKIPELIQAWYKAHKTGEDGRPTAFTVDEWNAEGRRAHLKADLLNAYPREEALIEEIMQGLEFENDDFNVLYGGRRRRRLVTKRRVTRRRDRNTNRAVSKSHSIRKKYRKNKTCKL